MTRLTEEQRIALLESEMKICQSQVDKYDSYIERIGTWAVALWVASLGWSFQVNRQEVVILNLVIVLVFWVLQGMNKAFRQDYKERRDEVARLLNRMGKGEGKFDQIDAPYVPVHKNLWKNTLENMIKPH